MHIKALAFNDVGILIGDNIGGAEVILVQIAGLGCGRLFGNHDGGATDADVALLFQRPALDDFFVELADVQRAVTIAVELADAVMLGVVFIA